MADENQLDATTISEDAIRAIVREVVEGHLKTETYKHSDVANWTSNILEEITKKLFELKKAYKFIVTILIAQKKDVAGFHSSTGAVWNDKTDSDLTPMGKQIYVLYCYGECDSAFLIYCYFR